jgi:RNA recognition motif-containing protein
MLKNLPLSFTRESLVELLDKQGFNLMYDFVYLPRDFGSGSSLGYALVNLTSQAAVDDFWARFEGFAEWEIPSDEVCSVEWSEPHQGLSVHVARYRNSPVMHSTVPESWKPAIFAMGRQTSFPPPTRKLKAPKVKQRTS